MADRGALLVGDIGGTNGRFGVAPAGDIRPHSVDIQHGDDHATFESAVAAYLDTLDERPRGAAFAVAGPVADGMRARITNRPAWEIDAGALERRFGLERVEVMNDFVAQAASLPHLAPGDVIRIGDPKPLEDAAKVAVGPGTGLGVAGLLPDRGGWRPVESEGGHVEFAATDAREAAAFAVIRRARGRLSAEDVVSGPGLARLHAALAAVDGRIIEPIDTPDIVKAAIAGDAAARTSATLFLSMLARFAGDVALTFGARGGAYLCGGVAPRLIDVLDPVAFRSAFESKTPHEAMMKATATVVVVSPVAGLLGCASEARRRGRDRLKDVS